MPHLNAKVIKLDKPPATPDLKLETELRTQGYANICGVDEVGRGPLAGPVVTAAVVLDPEQMPSGIRDSKTLSAAKREAIFEEILSCSYVGIASLSASKIDELNILQASLAAMSKAISALSLHPDYALIDGRHIPQSMPCPASAVIKGDQISLSIAAASIVSKVIRDQMMQQSALHYPDYGFAKHKGYGTKQHLDAIQKFGPLSLHRKSFAPLKSKI